MVLQQDTRHRVTDIYIFAMLLIYPLVLGPKGYQNITAVKFWFWASLTAAWILATLLLSVAEFRGLGRLNAAQVFALAFIAVCVVSALLSEYGAKCLKGYGRYDGIVSLVPYALTLIFVSAFGTFRTYHLAALAVSSGVCGIISLLQLWDIDFLHLFPSGLRYYDAHVKFSSEFLGPIGNVDLYSNFLCIAIPVLAGFYICLGKKSWWVLPSLFISTAMMLFIGVASGIVGCAAMVLALMPLLLTNEKRIKNAFAVLAVVALAAALRFSFCHEYDGVTVKAWLAPKPLGLAALGGAIIMAAIAVLPMWRKIKLGEKLCRRLFLIFDAVIVLGGLAVLWFWPGESGTVYELSQVLHGNIDPSFGSSRILIWSGVLPLIREHPILGGGPGTISQRIDIVFSRVVEETGQTLRVGVDNAHNVYLQILADTGLLGFVAYVGAIVGALLPNLRRCAPIVVAVVCYCVQDFFSLGLFITAPYFWIFVGLLSSRIEIGGLSEHE